MSAWLWTEDGWRHRPWWKVAINTVLRAAQPRLRRKFVIVSICDGGDDDDPDDPPRVRGYGFGRVLHSR